MIAPCCSKFGESRSHYSCMLAVKAITARNTVEQELLVMFIESLTRLLNVQRAELLSEPTNNAGKSHS